MSDPRHHGRRALVTGGSTGIGKAAVQRLAADGAAVVVNYIGPSGPADQLASEIADHGGTAVALEADVSNEQQVQQMFAQAADQLGGPIDLLVNNAGVEHPYELVDMPLEEWNRVISINLTGPYLCSRETARALRQANKPGTIVNVSSVHEHIPWRMFSHYCASKGGMKMFTETIAYELAPHGIRVLSVAPGAILTPINQNLIDDPKQRAAVESEIPIGRLGQPEEIASAISWLASGEAAYVTGTTLFVDGGMTLYPKFV
ncbi:MAG: glucose 1-dehydrogenase [Solirubrobacteraceae bacterium]|nr:MAG: glucose-1-dehydrogenase [Solirubrobacterales bacterium]